MTRLPIAVLVTAAVVVAIDQLTKSLALSALADGRSVDLFWTLRLDLSFNSGLAFSIGPNLTPLITFVAVVLVGVLLVAAHRVTSTPTAVALGLVLGGALGNLTDRLVRGHGGAVVDFIDLQWWPVFNVADMAITAGAILLVLRSFRDDRAGDA